MSRLSGQDALFLHLDRPHAATHATMIYIYDQSEMRGKALRFRDIVRHVEERLDASPLFRRKIVQVPLGLGYPYWADDEHFDIDFHIRHFALPKPGDWRQFCILASRIHARTLDLSRPPWEMYVIEGLDSFDWLPKGGFAILTKIHHAAVDGTALAELTWALHDIAGAKGKEHPRGQGRTIGSRAAAGGGTRGLHRPHRRRQRVVGEESCGPCRTRAAEGRRDRGKAARTKRHRAGRWSAEDPIQRQDHGSVACSRRHSSISTTSSGSRRLFRARR